MTSGKVLIVGSEREGSLEKSYYRAFAKLDWSVHVWDPQRALAQSAHFGKVGRTIAQFTQIEPWLHKANLQLLALASDLNPDLILIISTGGVHSGTLAQLRVALPKTKIYSLYPDTPHNLVTDRILCLPLFDRVIVYSSALIDVFQRMGARNVVSLGFAADTDLHYPYVDTEVTDAQRFDVSFIGNWRPEREAVLEQLTEFNLAIWGSEYWKTRTRPQSPLRKLWLGRTAEGEEFAKAVCLSKICLNILGPISWPGPNMRTFELPACKGFVLSERQPGVTELFEEGKTIECFDTIDEARSKIEYYLTNEERRREIAEAAYKFVTEHGHTYIDRANSIIKLLEQDQADA